jgi:hypothetical protein
MHEHVMEKKIYDPVSQNSETARKRERDMVYPDVNKEHGRDGEKNSKPIIPLEQAHLGFVMGAMQAPKAAVHDVFVARPCHPFHH